MIIRMPTHFLITKAFPAIAILLIYWIGSFNLPSLIFLPIALCVAVSVFYVTKKFGDKKEDIKTDKTEDIKKKVSIKKK